MRREGCTALLRNGAADLPYPLRMTKHDIAAARQFIEAALAREPPQPFRKRLIAVRTVLEGQSLAAAARATGATRASIARWLDQVREAGAAALLRDARLEHAVFHEAPYRDAGRPGPKPFGGGLLILLQFPQSEAPVKRAIEHRPAGSPP